jgi:hypothetical protein
MAVAASELDAWAGVALGDPGAISCSVSGADGETRHVTAAELGLRAIDVVRLAGRGRTLLMRGLASHVQEAIGVDDAHVDVDAAMPGHRSFAVLAETALAVARVLAAARPCRSQDLSSPAASAGVDDRTRMRAAIEQADEVIGEMQGALDSSSATGLRSALVRASRFGIGNAWPAADVESQAVSVIAELRARIRSASAATSAADMARALFGEDFVYLEHLPTPDSLTRDPAEDRALGATRAEITKWLSDAAQVRDRLQPLQALAWLFRARGARLDWRVAQTPTQALWAALPIDDGSARPVHGTVSFVMQTPFVTGETAGCRGLFVDEWTEILPAETVSTATAFHFDSPGSKAPQVVLIAVPPYASAHWQFDHLLQTLNETIDLAKIRLVDAERLDAMSALLPALYSPFNLAPEMFSVDPGTLTTYPPITAAEE